MKEFVTYTLARLGLFAACTGVALGLMVLLFDPPYQILWPLLIGAVASAVVSAYLLKDMRRRFADKISERATRAGSRFEEMRSREDID